MFLQNTKLYVTTAKKLSTSLNNGGYGLLSKVYSSSSTDANVQQLITTTIQNSDMNKPTIGRTRSRLNYETSNSNYNFDSPLKCLLL